MKKVKKVKKFKCTKHPKYAMKRQPTSSCKQCWKMFSTAVAEVLILQDYDDC